MSKQWKLTLVALVACLASLALPLADSGEPVQAAQGVEHSLRAVEIDLPALGQPVVMLEIDGEVEYESFVLDGPDRLVLDLHGVVNRLDQFRYTVAEGGVAQVRAGQHHLEPYPLTRVVFDLDAPLAYSIDASSGAVVVRFGDAETETAQALDTEEDPVQQVIEEMAAREPEAETETEAWAEALQPTEPAVIEVAEAPAPQAPEAVEPMPVVQVDLTDRAVEPEAIERLLSGPSLAAPAQDSYSPPTNNPFESRTIVTTEQSYQGKRISLNLVDADIKQVFRLFHEISGLNFVLDPAVSGRVTIVLDQVPWDQALDLILKNNGLDKVYENNVLRIATTQKLAQEAAGRKQLKEAEELEVEPITLTRQLSYAKATDVERVIRDGGILSQRGRVIVDERTNTLIISDVPKKVDPVDALINTLDTETPQVSIEARIVETSRRYNRELGIKWGTQANATAARGTQTGLDFPHNASARYALNLPGDGASLLGFSFGNVLDSFTLDLELNALEEQGEGRILSSPKITTQNNERAEIEQGVRIPIVSTTATEINVEFVSASLRLIVTPQITAEGTVVLDIVVENNSPDFLNTAGDIPSIRTQRAQTKVLIADGGTTVIGGIFVVNEGTAETGVPWFRKIPGFGWLFRNREITNENRELLIFITPKIVKLS